MTSTRNVLIVGGFADSLVNFRGDLIQNLLRRGANVHAAAPELSLSSAAGQALAAWGAVPHSVALARTGLNPASDLRAAVELYQLCRRVAPSHVLAYTAKPVIYGLPAARLAGGASTTALITGLGYAFTASGESLRRRLLQAVVSRLYRQALRSADRVVFQNRDDRELFLERGLVDPERCEVIHGSGINLHTFQAVPLPPLLPTLRFLLIARLLRDKGIHEFVAAARQVRGQYPHTEFHLVGGHDTNPAAIARADLERWIAEGSIIYHGPLSDVRPILARCHVYVLPSYREGTPRTVLEAMAVGRPVITTDVPGCRETVEHGHNGYLVPARDPASLAAAMTRLVESPHQLASFGAASRALVERKYDVDQINEQLIAWMGVE